MVTDFEKFKALHHAEKLFILPNAWDAKSAKLLAEAGYPAIGTSSAAVATSLGYEDGEGMPFADYLFVIRRILSSVDVPVTVDLEMGYGKTNDEIVENCRRIIELGVAGINIEDSIINQSTRSLGNAKQFANRIGYIKNKLGAEHLSLFINIRCDTYILNVPDKQKETLSRLKIYQATGADGIFLPCISDENDIAAAVAGSTLPLNIMCLPGLSNPARLDTLGVKRLSMGPFLFNKVYKNAAELAQRVLSDNDVSPIM